VAINKKKFTAMLGELIGLKGSEVTARYNEREPNYDDYALLRIRVEGSSAAEPRIAFAGMGKPEHTVHQLIQDIDRVIGRLKEIRDVLYRHGSS